jgi:hypothetical protein
MTYSKAHKVAQDRSKRNGGECWYVIHDPTDDCAPDRRFHAANLEDLETYFCGYSDRDIVGAYFAGAPD